MMIYPAIHYTMGGLWVDYELMTTVPGLFAIGECNFSDHGANRLGASALMQGLADGYFVLPYTIQNYLADQINVTRFSPDAKEFTDAENRVKEHFNTLMNIKGKRTTDSFHKELGKIMWDYVGMGRNAEGLKKAIGMIRELRKEFWKDLKISGEQEEINQELEKANRVADFFEIGELMAIDALNREESCGGHFREEYQTGEGEALRNDKDFTYVAAWEFSGENKEPVLHKESLIFENIEVKQRDYKK
ncbi:MAG: FAD-binding protein, partial [Bacteroidales bacterium]|nr:FAD-binding protein [Bacteroidales bacterium]